MESDHVEKLPFTQKGDESDQRHPWDVDGCVLPGDFVLVKFGSLAGKEGFVKAVTDSLSIVVDETRKDPWQPSFIVEGDSDPEVQPVSIFFRTII